MEKDIKLKKTPVAFLQQLIETEGVPQAMKLEAAKALLPYTAKKTAETLETVNRNYVIRDERLAGLTDEQLKTLIELVTTIAEPVGLGSGVEPEEVQHD